MANYIYLTKPENNPDQVKTGLRKRWSCNSKAKSGDTALILLNGVGVIHEWLICSYPSKDEDGTSRTDVQFVQKFTPSIPYAEMRKVNPEWPLFMPGNNMRGHQHVDVPPEIYEGIRQLRSSAIPWEIEKQNKNNKTDFANLSADREARLKRLQTADIKLKCKLELRKVYERNEDVVKEVLYLADGKCGACGGVTFYRKSDGSVYLEVHHKQALSDGGDDSVANCVALCPNCHREAHYG